jgi:hypothetical protein
MVFPVLKYNHIVNYPFSWLPLDLRPSAIHIAFTEAVPPNINEMLLRKRLTIKRCSSLFYVVLSTHSQELHGNFVKMRDLNSDNSNLYDSHTKYSSHT